MKSHKNPELYRFAALSLTIILIVYSGWLFGAEMFGTSFSHWRGGPDHHWQANVFAKFDVTDLSWHLADRFGNSSWGGLNPHSHYFVFLLLTWPIAVAGTALLWWKAAKLTENAFAIGFKLTAFIALLGAFISVGYFFEYFRAIPPIDKFTFDRIPGASIRDYSQFLRPMLGLFDWLILIAGLLATTNLLGISVSRWEWARNRTLWMSLSVAIAYLGAYFVPTGGTTIAVVTVLFISTAWLMSIYEVVTPSQDRPE